MNVDDLRDLHCRLLANEKLTEVEENLLLDHLQLAENRDPLLADEAMDTLMRGMEHITASSEDFIRRTVLRLESTTVEPFVFHINEETYNRPVQKWQRRYVVICAASFASLLISIGIVWRVWNQPVAEKKQELVAGNMDRPANPEKQHLDTLKTPAKQLPSVQDARFVSLEKSENAVWDKLIRGGDRLSSGPLELKKGMAELKFDQGTLATINAPAIIELRSTHEIFLQQGDMSIKIPKDAPNFTVRTPVSKVVERGSEFHVQVNEHGDTETIVRNGRIAITPVRVGERPGKTINLLPGEYEKAMISMPRGAGKLLPLSTRISGINARFMGLLSVNGKTGIFQTPESFQKFEGAMHQQLRESPEKFEKLWSMNVFVSGRGAIGYASIQINGERYQIEIYGDDP